MSASNVKASLVGISVLTILLVGLFFSLIQKYSVPSTLEEVKNGVPHLIDPHSTLKKIEIREANLALKKFLKEKGIGLSLIIFRRENLFEENNFLEIIPKENQIILAVAFEDETLEGILGKGISCPKKELLNFSKNSLLENIRISAVNVPVY